MNFRLFRAIGCAAVCGSLSLSAGCYQVRGSSSALAQSESTEIAPTTSVVALGRIIPQGEVIQLSVANAEDSRVNQILVAEGDWVEADEVIAVLQGYEGRQRDVEEAQKNVEYYRAILEKTRSGDAKQAEIAAQQANIARLEAQLRNEKAEREAAIASAQAELSQAQLTYQRHQTLYHEGAVSQEALDLAQEQLRLTQAALKQRQAELSNTVQTLQQQIAQEQENLATLEEVRPVDIRVAQAELERAMIAVEQRLADLEDTKVRVPVPGRILRINTRVGEQVNTQQGIVELGQTDQMYVLAEVYETEVTKVRSGQRAFIRSEYGGIESTLHGTVKHIGLQVGTPTLSEGSSNPTTDENTRVVEVKIRLDPKDSAKVAALTNMQVRVEIDAS
ncbi:MAG: HlyD family efflux transporter periplasmic adaptor subunit [Cyanophyceae cyanobacterium]